MKLKLIVLLSFIISSPFSFAQDLTKEFKNWYIAGVNVRLNKKTTLKLNRLTSFDTKGYQQSFNQTSLVAARRMSEKWEFGGGYAFSSIIGRDENQNYHRLSFYLTHRARYGSFRMKNTAQLEKYFPQLAKFDARLVLTNKWSYSNRKWPLRISPFVKNQLYYYQGGEPIVYWIPEEELEAAEEEDEVEESIEQSPNGWHRFRFTVGARSKLNKQLALSLFYTQQLEFNTGFAPYREINVPNKSKTRIKRPFNNYALVGMSLVYTFKTY